MTADLVAWLRQQFDHDEQWARAASRPYPYADEGAKAPEGGVHWRWVAGDNWDTVEPDPVLDEHLAGGAEQVWLATVEKWASTTGLPVGEPHVLEMPLTYGEVEEMDAAAAGHIALHDPARVLRQVAAHRAILARHGPGVSHPDECGRCNDPWPCEDVRALASIYEDREGFDPAWKVDG